MTYHYSSKRQKRSKISIYLEYRCSVFYGRTNKPTDRAQKRNPPNQPPTHLAAGHRQVPRLRGADGQNQGVTRSPHVVHVNVNADVGAGDKLDALLGQDVHPALDSILVELHVGDAVHQEAAHSVLSLVHGHLSFRKEGTVGGGGHKVIQRDIRDKSKRLFFIL